MNNIGNYEKISFPNNRKLVIDVISLGRIKHHTPILFEVDVSQAREFLQKYKQETGKTISFTGWIAKCIAMAVNEHPHLHALRYRNQSLILFDDVDILVTVQKQINEEEIPLPYVIRKANLKNVYEINDEIKNAQNQRITTHDMVLGKNPWFAEIYLRLPKLIRYAIGRALLNNPFGIKQNSGTVGISSIGMVGAFSGWAIPEGPLPLQFGLGSVIQKPWVVEKTIEIREILNIAFVFDHDIVDGAPVVKFLTRLIDLIQNGEYLQF